jgi:hypothetical protein
MKKYILVLAVWTVVLSCLGLMFNQQAAMAANQAGTPEATAKAFYTWFIPRLAADRGYPLMDKEIYKYVSKPTVDLLRSEYKKMISPRKPSILRTSMTLMNGIGRRI